MILVDVDGVAASRPGKPLFADLSLTISTGDRLGIVGLNGSGKSTLLRVLVGQEEPEAGVVRRGRDVRIAVLEQTPVLPAGRVLDAVVPHADEAWEAASVLDRLGMGDLIESDTATLSGGQAKRVALARTLVADADLLVLDEPTNHLDIDAIAWLEDRLATFKGGLVIVTHDRHVLDRLTTRVLELDRGRGYLHEGGYDAYLEGRAAREEQAAADEASRRILARRELEWLRRGAPARTRKPKARIEAATRVVEGGPAAPARAGDLDLARLGATPGADAGGRGWGTAGVAKRHPGTPRLGDKVIELHDVGHRWPEAASWLFRHVELALDNRERLGVVGANGSGKSTLLDVMAGRLEPTEGRVEVGPTARVEVYDQHGRELDLTARVRDLVDDGPLLDAFWFDADAQYAPVGLLSGGERRRLQLVITLARRPNVLLLDEPTNDLDLDTLRALEDHLEEWPGALVVVSHDRAFLERTVTDVVVLDGSGAVGRRPGGYAAWEADRVAARRSGRGRAAPRAGSASPGPTPTPTPTAATATDVTRPEGPSPSTLRHRQREIDKELRRLERRRAELEAALAEAVADRAELARLGAELTDVLAAQADAEDRWLAVGEQLEQS